MFEKLSTLSLFIPLPNTTLTFIKINQLKYYLTTKNCIKSGSELKLYDIMSVPPIDLVIYRKECLTKEF